MLLVHGLSVITGQFQGQSGVVGGIGSHLLQGHHVDGKLFLAGADKFADAYHFVIENAVGLIFQPVFVVRIIYITGQHRIKDDTVQLDPHQGKNVHFELGVLGDFSYIWVF